MRKLSLLIVALGATLGVSAVQADDTVDTSAATDTPEVVPYLPPESTGEEPTVAVDPVMYPVDKVMEVTSEGDPSATTEGSATDETAATDDGTVKEDVGTTEDPGATDGSGATDDSGATDGSGDTAGSDGGDGTVGPIKYDDTQIYTTTDTGPTRGTDEIGRAHV